MQKRTYTSLINAHQWNALIDLLPENEEVELKFPDIDSLECFRVRIYQKNAYGKLFDLSIRRRTMTIKITKL